MGNAKRTENIFIIIALIAIVSAFFLFGLSHLTKFVTADEHYWTYERIPQYWKALADGKIKKTLINDKPGVTTALISGIGLLHDNSPQDHKIKINDNLDRYNVTETESLYQAFRLPIIVFNGLFLIFFFWIIEKISNKWIALWSTAFIGLSPILIGISQIVNPDSFLWTFSAAAIFSYFALLKHNQKKYLFLSALFTGLAILSKYTANILFPFYLFSLFLYFLTNHDTFSTIKTSDYFKKQLLNFCILLVGSLLTISVFLPAVFIKPVYLYRLTMGFASMKIVFGLILAVVLAIYFDLRFLKCRICMATKKYFFKNTFWFRGFTLCIISFLLVLIIGRTLFPNWRMFEVLPFDIKMFSYTDNFGYYPNILEKYLLEFNPLVFSLTPVVLLSILFLLIRAIFHKNKSDHLFSLMAVIFFVFAYSTASIAADVVATVRYSIVLYPLLGYLAAVGIWDLSNSLSNKINRNMLFLLTVLIILISSISLFAIKPFYFNYASFLLPKNKLISDAWGYGGYEAAQRLNSLPDAASLTIWADYYGVCEFFQGNCITDYEVSPEKYSIDYYVITRRGKIRYGVGRDGKNNAIKAQEIYSKKKSFWEMNIDNRNDNYIKIFKADNELRSAIITDIDHCPSRASVPLEKLESFIDFSQEKEVDFIASLGDNASHRLRDCSSTADMDARFVANYLRSSGIPTHFILGDHDIESNTQSYWNWLETIKRNETFYSFDVKGIHIIILDTVLGGEPMAEPCEKDSECLAIRKRLSDLKQLTFNAYQQKYPEATTSPQEEKKFLKSAAEAMDTEKSNTRSWGIRDSGRVSDSELSWLEADINSTEYSKILVFSDHPLFKFYPERKSYDIVNGEKVREILLNSQKQIVAISGEAHLWHEEKQENIQYYIIDEFRKANGSWAYFTWDQKGFNLAKAVH